MMHAAARSFGNIEQLLEAFFGFLCTQTDFYHTQLSDGDIAKFGLDRSVNNRGFKPDHVRSMIARIFDKNLRLYRERYQPYLLGIPVERTPTRTRTTNHRSAPIDEEFAKTPYVPGQFLPRETAKYSVEKHATGSSTVSSELPVKTGQGTAFYDSSLSIGMSKNPSTVNGGSYQGGENTVVRNDSSRYANQAEAPVPNKGMIENQKGAANGPMLPQVSGVDPYALERLRTDFTLSPFNGGKTNVYCWNQTFTDVTIEVVTSEFLAAKDVDLRVTRDHIQLNLWGKHIFSGKLPQPVNAAEATWSIEDKRMLVISLDKTEERWWDSLVEGHPKIDVTQIESVKRFDEFSAPAQNEMLNLMKQHRDRQSQGGF
ncbi:NUCLEAR MOVEMENT PROTEIN NUDC, putative [Babesia bigemina]|uniref:Nuclear migration protein nudC n=1 Tax=Babesia bigemina TaxID=5866 RepID=A0A061DDW1_BABBI|nr:NUCLEAR MOVEMENT PROTEIN NUDC, putative [Babesia bigemina]CDR96625.1 NUCLEAR MOVEMENT PROTEIN NUDC, putative [Babesia bigemina]|eukprot:XP_012768811.1 NUCLEAR MOVEMENT PROTEIN NUDC, putative [Babesia bigemina]